MGSPVCIVGLVWFPRGGVLSDPGADYVGNLRGASFREELSTSQLPSKPSSTRDKNEGCVKRENVIHDNIYSRDLQRI